jgi:hypothetical protein
MCHYGRVDGRRCRCGRRPPLPGASRHRPLPRCQQRRQRRPSRCQRLALSALAQGTPGPRCWHRSPSRRLQRADQCQPGQLRQPGRALVVARPHACVRPSPPLACAPQPRAGECASLVLLQPEAVLHSLQKNRSNQTQGMSHNHRMAPAPAPALLPGGGRSLVAGPSPRFAACTALSSRHHR